MTGAAEEQTYGDFNQVSFLQDRSEASESPPSVKAANWVRLLGKKQRLPVLVQMAHKMDSVIRNCAISGEDPFHKVNGMVNGMLKRITKQMDLEATHEAYCNKELSDTKTSKDNKEAVVEKLATRVDTENSDAISIRERVSIKQKELLAILETQADMDKIRKQEHALHLKNKPELELGLQGIKKAMKILRNYYSQPTDNADDAGGSPGGGTGGTIISLLEVIEGDFAKGINEEEEDESTSVAAYETQTNENNVAKATKQQDVVHLNAEAAKLDKTNSQSVSDLDGAKTELEAISEYSAKIQEDCVAKSEPYEERRKRHETTRQGLKNALQVLQGSAALLEQRPNPSGAQGHLRGGFYERREDAAAESEGSVQGEEVE